MKLSVTFLLILFLGGCNQSGPSKKESNNIGDTIISGKLKDTFLHEPEISTIQEKKDPIIRIVDTSLLLNTSEEILRYIKNRNYGKFVVFIQPKDYVRFSPYAYIDTIKDRRLSGDQFLQLSKQNKKINWNSAWDEETELLTVDEYFKKFVYDADFLNAELKSINDYHSQGTDFNNITEVYPGCDVVEFFFAGFEKKYEGLDFRALRLVYKTENSRIFLAAIVHDKWTP